MAAAGTVVAAGLFTACSHGPAKAAASMEAAAAARAQAVQKARAAAAARDADRQQLDSIPLPSKNVYMTIHTRQSWENPFLVVSASGVSVSMLYPDQGPANTPGASLLRPTAARRRVVEIRVADLPEALTALPENAWPYGRVIAVEEDPAAPRQQRPQVRANVEATMQVLSDLGVVAWEWPGNAPH